MAGLLHGLSRAQPPSRSARWLPEPHRRRTQRSWRPIQGPHWYDTRIFGVL